MGYEVTFFPVGNGERSGDAIVVRFGNLLGHRSEQVIVVIDGGYSDDGKAIVEYIKNTLGTSDVDLVISTHPDGDHSAGLVVVLEELTVKSLWMHLPWNHCEDIAKMFKDGRVTDESVEEGLRKALDSARDLERIATRLKIPITEPFTGISDTSGNVFAVGPTKEYYESLLPAFRCTPAPKETALSALAKLLVEPVREAIRKIAERWDYETLTDDGETSAENNSSAVIVIRIDNNEFALFNGDAGIPALTHAADYLAVVGFNFQSLKVVQVPHHGSQRNVGPTILTRILGPRVPRGTVPIRTAVVSAAPDGEPKHPSKKVTNAVQRRGAKIFATQGKQFTSYKNSPQRYGQAIPLPFYDEVEE